MDNQNIAKAIRIIVLFTLENIELMELTARFWKQKQINQAETRQKVLKVVINQSKVLVVPSQIVIVYLSQLSMSRLLLISSLKIFSFVNNEPPFVITNFICLVIYL